MLIFFDCKVAFRPSAFNNSTIFPRVNYGAAVKLEMTPHWQSALSKFDVDIYHSAKF